MYGVDSGEQERPSMETLANLSSQRKRIKWCKSSGELRHTSYEWLPVRTKTES